MYVSTFLGFLSKKQTLKSPSSREKYRMSLSISFLIVSSDDAAVAVLFRSTRISYQLSVENAIARAATLITEIIVPMDKDTAEHAMINGKLIIKLGNKHKIHTHT